MQLYYALSNFLGRAKRISLKNLKKLSIGRRGLSVVRYLTLSNKDVHVHNVTVLVQVHTIIKGSIQYFTYVHVHTRH